MTILLYACLACILFLGGLLLFQTRKVRRLEIYLDSSRSSEAYAHRQADEWASKFSRQLRETVHLKNEIEKLRRRL